MDKELDLELENLATKVVLKHETFAKKADVRSSIMQTIGLHRAAEQTHKHVLNMRLILSAAACAALLFVAGTFGYRAADVHYVAQADSLAITLPEGSHITLMANSDVSYNKLAWHLKRQVNLNGDARFAVTKGKQFVVETPAGNVTVLGTKFYIAQASETMHVACMEGSVQVTSPVGAQVLKAGQSVDVDAAGMKFYEQELPEFINYEDAPLEDVVAEMEQIYHINIVPAGNCEDVRFTGALYTRDLTMAMEVVFNSCNLNYVVQGDVVKIMPK